MSKYAPLCQGSFEGICAAYRDLEAKLAAAERDARSTGDMLKTVSGYVGRLEHKLNSAERDAGRYRWLKTDADIMWSLDYEDIEIRFPGGGVDVADSEGIDAAIDAARDNRPGSKSGDSTEGVG